MTRGSGSPRRGVRLNAAVIVGLVAVFALFAALLWAQWNVTEDRPLAFDGDGPAQPARTPPPGRAAVPATPESS